MARHLRHRCPRRHPAADGLTDPPPRRPARARRPRGVARRVVARARAGAGRRPRRPRRAGGARGGLGRPRRAGRARRGDGCLRRRRRAVARPDPCPPRGCRRPRACPPSGCAWATSSQRWRSAARSAQPHGAHDRAGAGAAHRRRGIRPTARRLRRAAGDPLQRRRGAQAPAGATVLATLPDGGRRRIRSGPRRGACSSTPRPRRRSSARGALGLPHGLTPSRRSSWAGHGVARGPASLVAALRRALRRPRRRLRATRRRPPRGGGTDRITHHAIAQGRVRQLREPRCDPTPATTCRWTIRCTYQVVGHAVFLRVRMATGPDVFYPAVDAPIAPPSTS